MHAIPSCTILMTEWICCYKPFRIQCGESCQKGYLEEWEKVDVAQSYVSGEGKSCPTAIATETEEVQKTQEDERSSAREQHRGGYSLPKSSGEAVGTFDAPSWKYTGTQRSTVSWRSLGAQPPSKARARQFVHPRQVGNFSRQVGPAVPFLMRSYLAMRKMSRPYEMVFRPG